MADILGYRKCQFIFNPRIPELKLLFVSDKLWAWSDEALSPCVAWTRLYTILLHRWWTCVCAIEYSFPGACLWIKEVETM